MMLPILLLIGALLDDATIHYAEWCAAAQPLYAAVAAKQDSLRQASSSGNDLLLEDAQLQLQEAEKRLSAHGDALVGTSLMGFRGVVRAVRRAPSGRFAMATLMGEDVLEVEVDSLVSPDLVPVAHIYNWDPQAGRVATNGEAFRQLRAGDSIEVRGIVSSLELHEERALHIVAANFRQGYLIEELLQTLPQVFPRPPIKRSLPTRVHVELRDFNNPPKDPNDIAVVAKGLKDECYKGRELEMRPAAIQAINAALERRTLRQVEHIVTKVEGLAEWAHHTALPKDAAEWGPVVGGLFPTVGAYRVYELLAQNDDLPQGMRYLLAMTAGPRDALAQTYCDLTHVTLQEELWRLAREAEVELQCVAPPVSEIQWPSPTKFSGYGLGRALAFAMIDWQRGHLSLAREALAAANRYIELMPSPHYSSAPIVSPRRSLGALRVGLSRV